MKIDCFDAFGALFRVWRGKSPPGSCFDRPRIAEKVGEPVEPSAHPHCGAQTPPRNAWLCSYARLDVGKNAFCLSGLVPTTPFDSGIIYISY